MSNALKNNSRSALTQPTELNAKVVDEATYGKPSSIDELPSGSLRAGLTNILDIFPDPAQPRRQMPSLIRQQWNGQDIGELFGLWVNEMARESNSSFDSISAYIGKIMNSEETLPPEAYQGDDPHSLFHMGILGKALMAVVMLAAELRRDGLTNPITVIRFGNQFRIDTGERRWLAYHLLNLTYGGTAWTKIPAREVKTPSVWRQASENTARRQLNAIGMARQMALLVMDLYRQQGAEFMEYGDFEHDRHFYAQVADGNIWRVPRGKGEMLLNAMDLKDPSQLRQYRMLLSLPDQAWEAADDLGWAELKIRQLIGSALNDRHLVELVALEAQKEGYTVTTVTVWDEPEGEESVEPDPAPSSEDQGESVELPPLQIGQWVTAEATPGVVYEVVGFEDSNWGTFYKLRDPAHPAAEFKTQRQNLQLADAPAVEPPAPPPPPAGQPPQMTPPARPAASAPGQQASEPARTDPLRQSAGNTAGQGQSQEQPSASEIHRLEQNAIKEVEQVRKELEFRIERLKKRKITQAGNRNVMGNTINALRRIIDRIEEGYLS